MLEIASVIVLGIFAQWLAWKAKVPSILPLIMIGLLVGPLSEFWYHIYDADGNAIKVKFLEPIWNESAQRGLFPGSNLFYFVELAIGLILFEGGLSLKRDEIQDVGPSILKLSFFVAPFVTFFCAGTIVHFLFNFSWEISFLFSALIIVTGPTVISPILRNLRLKPNVSAVLKWEGILIDPVGALAAVLVFEFISLNHGISGGHGGEAHGSFTGEAITQLFQIIFIGLAFGTVAALGLRELLKRHMVPHYLLTVFTLGYVVATFVGSNLLIHDSGLLTIVVLGMVVGNIDMPYKEEITYFGESITILLISVLFILLSANINMSDLELLLNWKTAVLFLSIILFVRPLGVFLSTMNSNLSQKEKMFISWVGPRGIVAAGIASLFGLKLAQEGIPGAEYITPLVFMIVLGTVLLNATTAGLMAKWMGILVDKQNGILLLGANQASRILAKYLSDNNNKVILLDSNINNVQKSTDIGLSAYKADIYNDNELSSLLELNDMGFLLAMTGSMDVNNYALGKLSEKYGQNGAYRLLSINELRNPDKIEANALFSKTDDYINFSEVSRDYPQIHEVVIKDANHLAELFSTAYKQEKIIPLFIKKKDDIEMITALKTDYALQGDEVFVYMGKPMEMAN